MRKYNDWIIDLTDEVWKREMREILEDSMTRENLHVRYPADKQGAHLFRFFRLNRNMVQLHEIACQLHFWLQENNIEYNTIFAPNQGVVREIIGRLAEVESGYGVRLQKPVVLWEYLPTGRFGDKLVSGEIKPGDRVLVYNAVSIQGKCIGERLPSFVEALGGEVVAIACFAKGTTPKVRELEEKWGNKFYSAIQVDIPVYKPENCPMCRAGEKLIPWTEL